MCIKRRSAWTDGVGPRGNLEGERKRLENEQQRWRGGKKKQKRFTLGIMGLWEKGGRRNIPLFARAASNELG